MSYRKRVERFLLFSGEDRKIVASLNRASKLSIPSVRIESVCKIHEAQRIRE